MFCVFFFSRGKRKMLEESKVNRKYFLKIFFLEEWNNFLGVGYVKSWKIKLVDILYLFYV